MMRQTNDKTIPGAGIDGTPERRPGVPMELSPPRPAGNAHWTTPERQEATVTVLKRKLLDELPPVFGTAVPPRGASGLIRRAAYNVGEHRATHWLLLLMADRVDVLEHRLVRAATIALPLAALLAMGGRFGFGRRRTLFRRVLSTLAIG